MAPLDNCQIACTWMEQHVHAGSGAEPGCESGAVSERADDEAGLGLHVGRAERHISAGFPSPDWGHVTGILPAGGKPGWNRVCGCRDAGWVSEWREHSVQPGAD